MNGPLCGSELREAARSALSPEPAGSMFGPASVDVGVEPADSPIVVESGEHLVLPAEERVSMAPDLCAQVTGRSAHMRDGLFMPAGWIDPGYEGELKLEFGNTSDGAAVLDPLEPVARLTFFRLPEETDGYDGRWG